MLNLFQHPGWSRSLARSFASGVFPQLPQALDFWEKAQRREGAT
jgi:hypothetical protein